MPVLNAYTHQSIFTLHNRASVVLLSQKDGARGMSIGILSLTRRFGSRYNLDAYFLRETIRDLRLGGRIHTRHHAVYRISPPILLKDYPVHPFILDSISP
jgi:hypothetical protein